MNGPGCCPVLLSYAVDVSSDAYSCAPLKRHSDMRHRATQPVCSVSPKFSIQRKVPIENHVFGG